MCGDNSARGQPEASIMPASSLDEKKGRFSSNAIWNSFQPSNGFSYDESSHVVGTSDYSGYRFHCGEENDIAIFLNFSSDVVLHILSFLDPNDILQFGATCKAANSVVQSDQLWMSFCKQWKNDVPLLKWKNQAGSAKRLFQLLSRMDCIVGTWVAQDLFPRGGLLHVTWGNLSIVGYRIIPQWTASGVVCLPLFEVVGNRNGNLSVTLLSGSASKFAVSGALVFDNSEKSEFHLESFTPSENSHFEDSESSVESERDSGLVLRTRAVRYLSRLVVSKTSSDLCKCVTKLGPKALESMNAVFSSKSELCSNLFVHIPCSHYKRLSLSEPRAGRELAGLWGGIYGPHGLEIVSVEYSEDGMITASKIIGDPNVPTGQPSFRAWLDRDTPQVNISSAVAGDGRSVTETFAKAMKGEGHIAGHNFRNPRWMDGCLLVDRANRISFFWREANFIVKFWRLSLADIVRQYRERE